MLAVVGVLISLTSGACSCESELGEQTLCDSETQCGEGEVCLGGVCLPDEGGDGDGSQDVDSDGDGDGGGEECGTDEFICGTSCCFAEEVCEDGTCMPICGGTRCGVDCCDGEDLCLGDSCVTPLGDCEATEDCGLEEICEPSLGRCLSRDEVGVCEYRPPVGVFAPEVGCEWRPDGLPNPNRGDIVATPVVANLTDDNGDGFTNTEDVPNIVFPSFNRNNQGCCNVPATVRILHGACKDDGSMETIASISEPAINNDSGLALADLNNNGVPEIIGVTNIGGNPRGTVAFTRVSDDGTEWEVLWHNEEYPRWNVHTRGGAVVSVADLNGDGNPEVIIGNVVLNGQTGELLWDGLVTSNGQGGIGNNAFLGPSGTVADLTLDGYQEVIAGNTVYTHDGEVLWSYNFETSNSACQGALACDGFNGVANISGGSHPEVIIVREGQIFVIDHTGELVWKVDVPKDSCSRNESGPPTVADFNGDGYREIGTAGADFYVVAKMQCDVDEWADLGCAERGILWKTPNRDCSSRATASSVFDFDGDGRAEVVYADEVAFRIYDGTTGAVLFEDTSHASNTRIEMPIIVDTHNDGRAEVLVASAYGNRGNQPGLRVWRDADNNWVRTRRIWNQHGYSVTNINEDGSVPAVPERNWENPRLNNFRQNVQPAGLFDAPDLLVRSITVNEDECGMVQEVRMAITVANEGALSVPAGVDVVVRVRSGTEVLFDTWLETTQRLLPGQEEVFEINWSITPSLVNVPLEVEAVIDPDNAYNECDETNNELVSDGFSCMIQG